MLMSEVSSAVECNVAADILSFISSFVSGAEPQSVPISTPGFSSFLFMSGKSLALGRTSFDSFFAISQVGGSVLGFLDEGKSKLKKSHSKVILSLA